MDRKIRTRLAGVEKNKNDPGWDCLPPVLRHPTVLYLRITWGRCSNSGDVLDQKTTITKYTSRCLFFHDVWIIFLGFTVGLISRCCSRRELVEISLRLKLTASFPTASIPAILFFCGRRNAGDLSQGTFCVQNFIQEAPPLQPESKRYSATTLWFSTAKATVVSRTVSPRLACQCGSQEKQRVQASGSNLQVQYAPW